MMMIMVSVSEARCSGAEKGFITMSSPCTQSTLIRYYPFLFNFISEKVIPNTFAKGEHLPPKCLTLMCDLAMMVNLLFTRGYPHKLAPLAYFDKYMSMRLVARQAVLLARVLLAPWCQ